MDNEFTDRLRALANLEQIRAARIEPLLLRTTIKGDLTGTSDIIKLPKLRPGRIHIITNICFVEIGSGTPQVFLGILANGQKYYLFSDTVATAEDSVNWGGQAIALGGNEIFAEAQSAADSEELVLTANGYSMRL